MLVRTTVYSENSPQRNVSIEFFGGRTAFRYSIRVGACKLENSFLLAAYITLLRFCALLGCCLQPKFPPKKCIYRISSGGWIVLGSSSLVAVCKLENSVLQALHALFSG